MPIIQLTFPMVFHLAFKKTALSYFSFSSEDSAFPPVYSLLAIPTPNYWWLILCLYFHFTYHFYIANSQMDCFCLISLLLLRAGFSPTFLTEPSGCSRDNHSTTCLWMIQFLIFLSQAHHPCSLIRNPIGEETLRELWLSFLHYLLSS